MFCIDLHGYDVNQAISKLEIALFEAQEQGYDMLEIITGNGMGVLKVVVEEYLREGNYEWEIERQGVYLVYLQN
ncbi:DNA mismatch repair protein MutS [Mycoplasmopsis phocirhinis]|uniref:DNA mismatch repair protein MutS n=1 Tax=Mycoplasmopsis phocirhinis TaxID=142650 RepID=A0A4P6MT53_9BACT|nr:Smr/MutS family protein [Mycoplasmopsis phocirhinis]QBF34497.1 DNA mismatch repair protein MutS [Mycoplasmopsis phocirhinis]